MMMNNWMGLRWCLCLYLLIIGLVGGMPAEGARVRILCVEAAAGAGALVLMEKKEDGGWVAKWRFKVGSGFLTDAMELEGRVLGLAHDPEPGEDDGFFGAPRAADGLAGLRPFVEFRLPEGGAATAVLLSNQEENPSTPYQVMVLDSGRERFREGAILVQNLSARPVAGKFGGVAVRIEPGAAEVVKPGVDHEPGMAQITLASAVADGGHEVFCDTRWPAETDYRRYLILIPRAEGSVFPFVIPEYPPFP